MVEYFQTRLSNGLKVVGERHSYGNAVSLGFGIKFGSRDEHEPQAQGIAHLIEHLMFKRTAKYNSFELVNSLEQKGGDINAFTSKDFTCVHSYGLKEDLKQAVDVLTQICFFADWSSEDFAAEKRVVEQEILMSLDNPEDHMFDDFTEEFFAGTSLAHPIFGSLETLKLLTEKSCREYYQKFYQPKNMVVAVSGNFEWDSFLSSLQECQPSSSAKEVNLDREFKSFAPKKFVSVVPKSIGQCHMILGCGANSIRDGVHYPISILSNYLSGGMNSRLFRELREEKGLCYSVSASYGPNDQVGSFSIASSTGKELLPELLDATFSILKEMYSQGIKQSDLDQITEQIRCGLLLGESDIDSRMHSILFDSLFDREYRSVATIIKDLCSVSLGDMNGYIANYLPISQPATYLLGPFSPQESRDFEQQVERLTKLPS